MNMLSLKILTPQITLNQEADLIILPGSEGELGILPNHSPLIVSLKMGMVKAQLSTNASEVKIFISTAIANVNLNKVEIVTDFAVNLANVTEEEIVNKIAVIEKKIINLGVNDHVINNFRDQLNVQQLLLSSLKHEKK